MEAWPADSTKRSRSGHVGSIGAWRRKRVQSTYAIGAAPIGAPGCPEFAFWTASIERVRMVSIARRSTDFVATVMGRTPFGRKGRGRTGIVRRARAGTANRRPAEGVAVG